jgi:large subunit ribosomal protein L10
MKREEKTAVVEELSKELSDADAVLAVDYRGISVPQAAELRSDLRQADTRFRVVKNRLTLRAADEAGADPLKEHLSGPTALALVQGDVALAAKTIHRLGTEWELLTFKGGIMDGEALDPDSFQAIAKLPGRDALNAQFAGVVASPLTGLVRGLGSMVQGLASQLQQIADQGLVTGEAPVEEAAPAEVEAPPAKDEAPAEDETPPSEPEAESADDPQPEDSPEEATEEEPAPGEDVSPDDAEETAHPVTEGDAEIGSTQEEGPEDGGEQETSEDSDENKEADQ